MKAYMRNNGIDFFATNTERQALMDKISPKLDWIYQKIIGNGGILFRTNIGEEISKRLLRLLEFDKLILDDHAKYLYISITGDKGGKWTKIGMFPLNVHRANDPSNLTLLAIYEGSDSVDNLRLYCSNVFAQLNALNGKKYKIIRPNGVSMDLELQFVLVGDMAFLVNMYGLSNLWSRNSYCLFCDISKKNQIGLPQPRNFTSAFRRGDREYLPALSIPISNVVPSTLHIFLGLTVEYFKKLENIAMQISVELYDQMQTILSRNRLERQRWFMCFTGNQVHKLIGSDTILDEIRGLIPSSHKLFNDASGMRFVSLA
ncbi:hypothetical protein Ddc_24861 [Ditylenchus destructor]|nr:hypothetical protein Ddc_24861 [Ditylenchus destructor]